MKSRKKSVFVLIFCSVISFASFMFLHSEAQNSLNFVISSNFRQERVEKDIPILNQGKLVKFLFESLIKLVPES